MALLIHPCFTSTMRTRAAFLLLASAALFSCNRDTIVSTLSGQQAEVIGHSKFAVVIADNRGKNASDLDYEITEKMDEVVTRQYSARGYDRVPMAEADIVIAVDVQISGYSEFHNMGAGVQGSTPLNQGGPSFNVRSKSLNNSSQTTSHQDALVMFDIVDLKKKAVLWKVSARSRISPGTSAAQVEKLVAEVIGKLPASARATVAKAP